MPDELRGAWRHCVLLTYGADFPFFERTLWRQFYASCRNKVILADGRHFLDSCTRFAEGEFVRLMNQQYVAEGIYSGRGSHAKLILLASEKEGRLLVGSGNLGWQGFASGGEVFAQYNYSDGNEADLPAFAAARDFLQSLVERRYVGDLVRNRFDAVWEGCPWLFQAASAESTVLLHNLERPLIDQLDEAIAEPAVDEMVVMAPFFDEQLVALRSLIERFSPNRATVMLQPRKTSVDPGRLRDLLRDFEAVEIRPFEVRGSNSYVHAKLFLFRTGNAVTCVHGSANISISALMLTPPEGNIELLNVVRGPSNSFDHVLTKLSIGEAVEDPSILQVEFDPVKPEEDPLAASWTLLRAELKGSSLRIDFKGSPPSFEAGLLIVGISEFPLDVLAVYDDSLQIELEDAAAALLQRPAGVAVAWRDDGDLLRSNSVVPSNRTALDSVLAKPDHTEDPQHLADLELEDEELASLLAALEGTLVLDDRSIWQVAGRDDAPSSVEADGEVIAYEEIDYELIKRHPKIQQYKAWGTADIYGRSRLQLILKAITDHFHFVFSTPEMRLVTTGITTETDQPETEVEREEEEEKRQRRIRTLGQRNELLFRNFIRRYLRGFEDREFRKVAGFDVMVQNYRIFVFILWRLFSKDWMRPDFLVDSVLRAWKGFWGGGETRGYLAELPDEERNRVLEWIIDQHADAELLATLYFCGYLSRAEEWNESRFALRDWFRSFVENRRLDLSAESFLKAHRLLSSLVPYETPHPIDIASEVGRLVSFETRSSLARAVEMDFGLPHGACGFERVNVARPGRRGGEKVDCLVIKSDAAIDSPEVGLELISRWRTVESLDYYRIAVPEIGRLIFLDLDSGTGYWRSDRKDDGVDLVRPSLPLSRWESVVTALNDVAAEAEELLQAEAISA